VAQPRAINTAAHTFRWLASVMSFTACDGTETKRLF
jgi:hypothetical protein